MRANVCGYELDAPGIADMVQGNLMPHRPAILTSVIQITMFGQPYLPENWRRNLFRVRRKFISWLKVNNPKFYGHVNISSERLESLLVNGVPLELLAVHHLDGDTMILNKTFLPELEEDKIADLSRSTFNMWYNHTISTL